MHESVRGSESEIWLGPTPDQVSGIVVFCPGGLANAVRVVPALRHLRFVYPTAKISVVVGDNGAGLLERCPHVDHVYTSVDAPELILAHFSLAISFADPNQEYDGVGRAARFDEVIQADLWVRYRSAAVPASPAGTIAPLWPVNTTTSARMLSLVWLLGGRAPERHFALWPTLVERNKAATLVAGFEKPIAVMHLPGDCDVGLTQSNAAALVRCVADHGCIPILVGCDIDEPNHAEIALLSGRALDITGQTDVGVLAALLERSSLFVGADSGPSALAHALGVKSVVIAPQVTPDLLQAPVNGIVVVPQNAGSACAASTTSSQYSGESHSMVSTGIDQAQLIGAVALMSREARV